MIRVSGGFLRGRQMPVPGGGVRPTQDKVRQALFSSLGPIVDGCRFLDLFAGSGSVGLEAWSRGAAFVCWVEKDPRVAGVLKHNIESLCGEGGGRPGVPGTLVVKADAIQFVLKSAMDRPFDVIFADPPYGSDREGGWLKKTLQALMSRPMLAPNGFFVAEQGGDEPVAEYGEWHPFKERTYGKTRLLYWQK